MGEGITTLNIIIKTEKLAKAWEMKLKHDMTWEDIILDWANLKESLN